LKQWIEKANGINIKLAKCGGLARARQMIEIARETNMQIFLGCMLESSLGVTAAAHLAPLVDFIDLDGAALLSNDPFDGMKLIDGQLEMPNRPGIGTV
jgi:L-alanine-DL-glutamate epimerase-like enolase superfamily enzyme